MSVPSPFYQTIGFLCVFKYFWTFYLKIFLVIILKWAYLGWYVSVATDSKSDGKRRLSAFKTTQNQFQRVHISWDKVSLSGCLKTNFVLKKQKIMENPLNFHGFIIFFKKHFFKNGHHFKIDISKLIDVRWNWFQKRWKDTTLSFLKRFELVPTDSY